MDDIGVKRFDIYIYIYMHVSKGRSGSGRRLLVVNGGDEHEDETKEQVKDEDNDLKVWSKWNGSGYEKGCNTQKPSHTVQYL